MPEMKPLQINTGRISVPVRDPYGVDSAISFNPSDANFRQKFLDMAGEADSKFAEYKKTEDELDKKYPAPVIEEDEDGNEREMTDEERKTQEVRAAEQMKMEQDLCDYMEDKIDSIFGGGTCIKVFGGDRVPFAYLQFIEAVTPYFKESHESVTKPYLDAKANRQQRRATTKGKKK